MLRHSHAEFLEVSEEAGAQFGPDDRQMRGLTCDKGSRSVPTVGYGPGMATADSPLERALAGGKPHPTGWFRLYFEDERWEWSPEVERLHGYEPGTAKPTTSIVLSHKHPEDYEQVAATLDDIRRTHRAFSTRHRIIDVQGRIHEVIVVLSLIHI